MEFHLLVLSDESFDAKYLVFTDNLLLGDQEDR